MGETDNRGRQVGLKTKKIEFSFDPLDWSFSCSIHVKSGKNGVEICIWASFSLKNS